jgi:FkbM family methyltransferase
MRLKSRSNSIFKYLGLNVPKIRNKANAFRDQDLLLDKEEIKVIFDLGAYFGEVTSKYRALFPEATIYSFEPFSDSFRKLLKKSKGNTLTKPFQLCISDRVGKNEFFLNSDPSCNSLFKRSMNSGLSSSVNNTSAGTIDVNVTTIDEFCKKEIIQEIDILKLDIEGSELLALKGASEKLSENLIKLIYTEIMFVPHYEGGVLFHELSSFLSGYGYTLFNLYDLKRAANGQLRWGNSIFINPHIRAKMIDSSPHTAAY